MNKVTLTDVNFHLNFLHDKRLVNCFVKIWNWPQVLYLESGYWYQMTSDKNIKFNVKQRVGKKNILINPGTLILD